MRIRPSIADSLGKMRRICSSAGGIISRRGHATQGALPRGNRRYVRRGDSLASLLSGSELINRTSLTGSRTTIETNVGFPSSYPDELAKGNGWNGA
jgi:hypothetical protein